MKSKLIINEDEVKIHTKTVTSGARILSYIDHFTTDRENLIIRSDDEFLMIKKLNVKN